MKSYCNTQHGTKQPLCCQADLATSPQRGVLAVRFPTWGGAKDWRRLVALHSTEAAGEGPFAAFWPVSLLKYPSASVQVPGVPGLRALKMRTWRELELWGVWGCGCFGLQ